MWVKSSRRPIVSNVWQDIFADDTYSKPFFVTYVNCSFFSILLIPLAFKYTWQYVTKLDYIKSKTQRLGKYTPISEDESRLHLTSTSQAERVDEDQKPVDELRVEGAQYGAEESVNDPLTLKETIRLSLEFSMLWVSLDHQLNCG